MKHKGIKIGMAMNVVLITAFSLLAGILTGMGRYDEIFVPVTIVICNIGILMINRFTLDKMLKTELLLKEVKDESNR